jgi:carbonic anhydrase
MPVIDIVYRYDPNQPAPEAAPETAAEARALLEQGNAIYANVVVADAAAGTHVVRVIPVTAGNLGLTRPGETRLAQVPFAVVIGCADARVPIELIFAQAANDLFVLRVAGNVLDEAVLGSVDYALHQLAQSIRLIVVLGHTGCGAVTAAVDAFLDPAHYLALAAHHQLRAIVNHIFPAIRVSYEAIVTAHGLDARNRGGFREALIEASVAVNAAMVASTLRHQVAAAGVSGVEVVFGVYDLETRHVGLPAYDRADERGHLLLDPPDGGPDFTAQAALLVTGPRIKRLLARM